MCESPRVPEQAISAVVTGAAAGLGLAVARQLTSEGARVVGVDVDEAGLARAADELGLEPVVGDVAEWATHERAADAAEALGALGGWVNNAGIDIQGAAHEVTEDEVDRGLRILLTGAIAGTVVAVRRMLPNRRGSIVNVSSVQGAAAFPALPRVRRGEDRRAPHRPLGRRRLRPARHPLQHGAPRDDGHADDGQRPLRRTCRARRRSVAKGSWRRSAGSRLPRRWRRSSASCSPTAPRTSQAHPCSWTAAPPPAASPTRRSSCSRGTLRRRGAPSRS